MKHKCLEGKAAITGPVCFPFFVCRLEHTCGTEAQLVDSSGIRTQDLQHFRAKGRRAIQLSYLRLLNVGEKSDQHTDVHTSQRLD